MRKSYVIAITLAAISASIVAGCSQRQSTPVVSAPAVTTQPAEREKNWLSRQADATWDVMQEPAGWFKSAPKQPAKPAAQPSEPPEPVQITITPGSQSPPGVIVTDEQPATAPGQ